MKYRKIDRQRNAGKYAIVGKRGKTKAATTGKYQAREMRASKVILFEFEFWLPDWLKLHYFGPKKSRELPRS